MWWGATPKVIKPPHESAMHLQHNYTSGIWIQGNVLSALFCMQPPHDNTYTTYYTWEGFMQKWLAIIGSPPSNITCRTNDIHSSMIGYIIYINPSHDSTTGRCIHGRFYAKRDWLQGLPLKPPHDIRRACSLSANYANRSCINPPQE